MRKMREIRDGGNIVGLDRIAVMAALNLAHELLKLRGRGESARHATSARRFVRCANASKPRSPKASSSSSEFGRAAVNAQQPSNFSGGRSLVVRRPAPRRNPRNLREAHRCARRSSRTGLLWRRLRCSTCVGLPLDPNVNTPGIRSRGSIVHVRPRTESLSCRGCVPPIAPCREQWLMTAQAGGAALLPAIRSAS